MRVGIGSRSRAPVPKTPTSGGAQHPTAILETSRTQRGGAGKGDVLGDRVATEKAKLTRWRVATDRTRQVVCLGDSITDDGAMVRAGIRRNWVDQVAEAFDLTMGPRRGDGFRGLWRAEWRLRGTWTETMPSDAFDVTPFRQGFYSSGETNDVASWTKPRALAVEAFDLYWFHCPGMGQWQYRVDEGPWRSVDMPATVADNRLHRLPVSQRVRGRVEVRGFDGRQPCVASIGGISTCAPRSSAPGGTVVHNLGHKHQLLAVLCRPSEGDPLAILDDIRPDLVTVLFSNDVILKDPERFGDNLDELLRRVSPYADVLVIAPFEQRPRAATATAHDTVVTRVQTTAGSPIVRVSEILFVGSDIGAPLAGTNIPEGATIASLESAREATMTVNAIGSDPNGTLVVGRGRDAALQAEYRSITKRVAEAKSCAFVDLYQEWADDYGAGWDAAHTAGLMQDVLHPSQQGHDDIATRVKAVLI